MSNASCCGCNLKQACLIVGVLLAMLLGGLLMRRLVDQQPARSPRAARAEERAKNRHDYVEALKKETSGVAVLNAAEGIYRIPVEQAMEITVREWRNPEAARKQLNARVEKAFAAPPAAPAPPSKFE